MVIRKSANLLPTSLRKRQRGAEFRKIELMLAKVPQVRTRQVRTSASASARKISTATPVSPHVDPSKDTKEKAFGFRFVDMSILSGIFELLPCKECKECNLELLEDSGKRKGCASYLHLVCSTCNWKKEFYTSSQVNRFFEVNRRMVYSMRSVGCGPAAAKRFCGLMNMPPPPRPTPYSSHNREILKATKTVFNCFRNLLNY